jgi:Fe-S cluster assembly protein SufB
MTTTAHPELDGLGRYAYGWRDSDEAGAKARRGLNEDVVREISALKNEQVLRALDGKAGDELGGTP